MAALVAAAPDDALWKPAHRGVLMATRDPKPRSRLLAIAALAAVVDRLQEEYLVLLPEVGWCTLNLGLKALGFSSQTAI